MQNIKYHSLNMVSVIFFSYCLAATGNQVVKYNLSPTYDTVKKVIKRPVSTTNKKDFEHYKEIILTKNFFKVATPGQDVAVGQDGGPPASSVDDLNLIGTITGPASIARAMIGKKGEKEPKIFALYKVNSEITNDVFGYKLVGIANSKVYLKMNNEKMILELYAKKESEIKTTVDAKQGGGFIKKTISRAEMKQNVLNNMDKALQGLSASQNWVNGKVDGYKLVMVRPFNILYKLGARSGDIIKRVNGRAIDSTPKLYQLWESLQNESKITVDLERYNKTVTYEFNITD